MLTPDPKLQAMFVYLTKGGSKESCILKLDTKTEMCSACQSGCWIPWWQLSLLPGWQPEGALQSSLSGDKEETPFDLGNRILATDQSYSWQICRRTRDTSENVQYLKYKVIMLARDLDRSWLNTSVNICKFALNRLKHNKRRVSIFGGVRKLDNRCSPSGVKRPKPDGGKV